MHSAWDRENRFPDPSLEPPNAVPCFSGPPWTLPKPTRELPGPPQNAPETTQGPSRTSNIVKVDHQKPSQIWLFGPQVLQKIRFFQFHTFPGAPGAHLGSHPDLPDPPHGAQKRSQALPRTSLGETWALQSTPVNFNLATVLLKVDDCLILHRFPMLFINFQIQ